MSEGKYLSLIYEKLPELAGLLHVEHVEYQATSQKAVVFFTSDVLVGSDQFRQIQKFVRQSFPQMGISIRVASPSLAEDFMRDPGKYKHVINQILQKHYPAMNPYLPDIKWSCKKERLVLFIPDAFAHEYLSRQDVKQRLADSVYDIFLIKPEIEILLTNDIEDRVARLQEERLREEKLLSEELEVKTKKEEKKKSKKITGSIIAAEPTPIKDLTELSGRVIVAGKVIQVEKRNIQKSDSVLLLFTISDLTDSIACKIFLGFKPNGYQQHDIASDPEKERRKVEEVLSRVVPGVGLKVRGTCQIDSFDNVLTIMVRDINAFELETRKDNSSEKRIELHAHTHMSYMDAMMSASSLIQRAAEFGHKAIAITDHCVVQAYPEAFGAAK